MNIILFSKRYYLCILVLVNVNIILPMDQKQRIEERQRADQQYNEQQRKAQQQQKEKRQREEQQRRREAIDRMAKQELERTRAAKNVSINPSASQNLQFKATNHNVHAFHLQGMQNWNRKK